MPMARNIINMNVSLPASSSYIFWIVATCLFNFNPMWSK
ncbi:hypothetical protein Ahy_A09g046727 isoform A [Arachis hypogaea]|uniref:Uncharacterized protein n=1 Tax=Arachis hypogaea TaxID=3818 RepID=A0A445BQM4_ARAHY|nr:hypothetical protein Ahy_A09g046727 isoform A [Arachis hypogaea]